MSVLVTKNGEAGLDIYYALEILFTFACYFSSKKIRLDIKSYSFFKLLGRLLNCFSKLW